MKFGVHCFLTDLGPQPREFGEAAEGHGFDALFLPEHTHYPVATADYPQAYGGGQVPSYYLRTHDQMVALSIIAASTSTIKLATGISLLAQHDPIAKAKQLASLDFLSGGRVIFGVGFGWNVAEAVAHGVVWKRRYGTVRDKVAVMRALWTQEEASYDGTEASLAPSFAWPKPQQAGGPPIYLGGTGPTAMRHAAQWADVWYPGAPPDDPKLGRLLPKFRQILDEVGRDPATIGIAVSIAPDPWLIEHYQREGIEQVVLRVEAAETVSEGMRNLERVGRVLAQVQGSN